MTILFIELHFKLLFYSYSFFYKSSTHFYYLSFYLKKIKKKAVRHRLPILYNNNNYLSQIRLNS